MRISSDIEELNQDRCIVWAEFVIRGDLDPDEVTTALKVTPDQTWRKGAPTRSSKTSMSIDSLWSIRTPRSDERDVTTVLEALLSRFESKQDAIKELLNHSGRRAYVSIIVEMQPAAPGFCFDSNLLRRLANLGVDLDVDLYATPLPDDL